MALNDSAILVSDVDAFWARLRGGLIYPAGFVSNWDLAHVKGKECITPLHYVVETGDRHIDLLDKFLLVCPDSIRDVTVRDETALHIALKNDQLKAFKFLVGWLGINFFKNSSSIFKNSSSNVKAVLDQKDDEGNTVLHITV